MDRRLLGQIIPRANADSLSIRLVGKNLRENDIKTQKYFSFKKTHLKIVSHLFMVFHGVGGGGLIA